VQLGGVRRLQRIQLRGGGADGGDDSVVALQELLGKLQANA
jgi:hypothetical protein